MAGLVPAIPLREARCSPKRDARDKPGHDGVCWRRTSHMQLDGYDIDIVVQGYPGKTVCHGGLGWSTIALIRGRGRVALVDTGGFGVRPLLLTRLKERGLKPADVTDLMITHAHHDHMVNWTM